MMLELACWGDGSIRLAYWDRLHGDDIIIRLDPEQASKTDAHIDDDGEDVEPLPNLIAFLREMAQKEK